MSRRLVGDEMPHPRIMQLPPNPWHLRLLGVGGVCLGLASMVDGRGRHGTHRTEPHPGRLNTAVERL